MRRPRISWSIWHAPRRRSAHSALQHISGAPLADPSDAPAGGRRPAWVPHFVRNPDLTDGYRLGARPDSAGPIQPGVVLDYQARPAARRRAARARALAIARPE